ncbi:MAG: serine/threonine protein kinase [Acidobacteria bacterium]|nr:serine/threonine protein kinase [Acidobacteriota bacterium]
MTTQDRYLKVKELFMMAIGLQKNEQYHYLRQVCGNDPTLLAEVEALILAEEKQHPIDQMEEKFDDIIPQVFPRQQITQNLFSSASARNNDFNLNGKIDDAPANKLHQAKLLSPIFNIKAVGKNMLELGSVINKRYLVESEFSQGGFSLIYLAKDLQLDARSVLIKVMREKIDDDWLETKFFEEVKALSRINHPNVVSIFDYGLMANGRPFFVMELIPGESLENIISKARMGLMPKQALNIIKQIGNALNTVHQLGIYHRDLKPANIIIRKLSEDEEHVKLIDFGIATVKESISAVTTTTSVVGTPTYMAPEQFEGNPSGASDIYALGVIAYELLTGRPPFNITLYKHLKEIVVNLRIMQQKSLMAKPSQLSQNLSLEVDEVLFKSLSFDPQNRYAKPSDFVRALSNALNSVGRDNLSWEKLCSLAKSTNRIWFINEQVRKKVKTKDVSILDGKASQVYKLNTPLSMVLDLKYAGYLLLLAKDSKDSKDSRDSRDSSDKVICLCPSRFAASDRLDNYPLLLPTEGLIYHSLPLNRTKGRKQLLAIISQKPLELTWPSATFNAPMQALTISDIDLLFSKLEVMPPHYWSAFYSYVDII